MLFKVFPNKMNIVFLIIFSLGVVVMCGILGFSGGLIPCIGLVSTLLVLLLLNMITNKIELSNDNLMIKYERGINVKVENIPVNSIIDLKSRKISFGPFESSMFFIHYLKETDEYVFQINENNYFEKDIKALFEEMENNFSIPFIYE